MARSLLLIMALLAVAASRGAAQNPRISLKLENVTAQEAADRLGRAAGVPVEIGASSFLWQGEEMPKPALPQYCSFDWRRTSFAAALRQLCARYDLEPFLQWGSAYVLVPRATGSQRPRGAWSAAAPRLQRGGTCLFVDSVTVSEQRTTYPPWTPSMPPGYAGTWIEFACLPAGGEGEIVAGVQHLRAQDSRGRLLKVQPGPFGPGPISPRESRAAPFPDEWVGGVGFSSTDPGARKLAWVEGDLMVYSRRRTVRLTLPMPPQGETARTEAGSLRVSASWHRIGRAAPGAEPEGAAPALPPTHAERWGVAVRVRAEAPVGQDEAIPDGTFFARAPVVVGEAGRLYAGKWLSGDPIRTEGQTRLMESGWHYRIEERPVRVLWDLVTPGQPEKRFSFRFTDIPLPARLVFPAAGDDARIPDRSSRSAGYRREGGGSLLSRVRIGGSTAPAGGALAIGLSVRQAEGWSVARWTRIPLAAGGSALLKDLIPGPYRILRAYHFPGSEVVALPPGRWLNAEVTAAVAAGKETVLPPLLWLLEAPPESAKRNAAGMPAKGVSRR